jgi:PhnB protein
MNLNPYIMFSGQAEEALNFYKEVLGGQIQLISRYGDAPMDVPDNYKDKLMHATMTIEGNHLMLSDSFPGKPVTAGNNVHLSLNFNDTGKLDSVFARLAEGGNVTMPVDNTFWGARFGMLTDKFGINWMFNCELKK